MKEKSTSKFRDCSDTPFCNSIFVMRIDPTVMYLLIVVAYMLNELGLAKDAIVSEVFFY
jgi:hypothetical protein